MSDDEGYDGRVIPICGGSPDQLVQLYAALVRAGFSKGQALAVIVAMIRVKAQRG